MVYKKNFKSFANHLRNNFLIYFILVLIFVLGNIIGPLLLKGLKYDTRKLLLRLSNPYFKSISFINFSNNMVFRNSLMNNLLLLLVLTVSSFFSVGVFLIPFAIFFKGLTIGLMVGYLVSNFGFKGFLISILGILPQNIFLICGLIGFGALCMSYAIGHKNQGGRLVVNTPNSTAYKYVNLSFFYVFLIAISTLIEGYFSPIFLRFVLRYYI